MKRSLTLPLVLMLGIGSISAVSVQGLHAQTKPKAFSIGEYEVIGDQAALDAFAKVAIPAVEAAGGKPLGTPGGNASACSRLLNPHRNRLI